MERDFDNIQECYHRDPENDMDYEEICCELSCVSYDLDDLAVILKDEKNAEKRKKLETTLKFLQDKQSILLKVFIEYEKGQRLIIHNTNYEDNNRINAYYKECIDACYDY
jgi:flagellar biosynthesis/type III secretory pathway chaperone